MFNPDALDTLPISKLAVLRADAAAARQQRDLIEDLFSPAWTVAHREVILASAAVNAELERIQKKPDTRHVELMVLGYV